MTLDEERHMPNLTPVQAAELLGVEVSALTYGLRTCDAQRRSYNGFQWPQSGIVAADDWNARDCCGHGLHYLPMGEGRHSLLGCNETAQWLVLAVVASEAIAITEDGGGKSKAPRAVVLYAGEHAGAADLICALGADRSKLPRGQATASGNYGQATASGDYGQATASGNYGQATASGDYGQATASGNYGQATASGTRGSALASYRARAGELGLVLVFWWDAVAQRNRVVTGYVGENGIEPNVWYRAEAPGILVRTDNE